MFLASTCRVLLAVLTLKHLFEVPASAPISTDVQEYLTLKDQIPSRNQLPINVFAEGAICPFKVFNISGIIYVVCNFGEMETDEERQYCNQAYSPLEKGRQVETGCVYYSRPLSSLEIVVNDVLET